MSCMYNYNKYHYTVHCPQDLIEELQFSQRRVIELERKNQVCCKSGVLYKVLSYRKVYVSLIINVCMIAFLCV